jgi:PiT family inorganic phosphate transporter
MLILIGIVPAYFALQSSFNPSTLSTPLHRIEQILNTIDPSPLSNTHKQTLADSKDIILDLNGKISGITTVNAIPKNDRFLVRKNIMILNRNVKALINVPEVSISEQYKSDLSEGLSSIRKITDYSPRWVILMISLSLGLGTMIGWKRIVKTVGEKIGKEHLTYAQGASAEIVTASTIALSISFGLPVSTTHVLSSGIAGSMVASKGIKNLQPDTVRNILMAWFLTLPVVMILSGSLFLLFRALL